MSIFTERDLMRFTRLMSQFKLQIKSKMMQYKKWTTGKTWNTIEPYATEENGTLSIGLKSTNPIPVKVQETGRGPGKVPIDFEDIIFQWSMDKGIQFKNQDERKKFANAVKFKMMKEGSVQFKQGTNNDIFTNQYKTYDAQLTKIIAEVFADKVKKELFINFL